MMVVGLQLPFRSLPLHGVPGTSQPMDSKLIQLPSFGELLRLKEKQLQQEHQVSASALAAALAVLQTQSMVLPYIIPSMATGEDQVDAYLDSSPQANVDSSGISATSIATEPTTARFVSTESAAPVAQGFPTLHAGSVLQPGERPDAPALAVGLAGLTSIDTTKMDFVTTAAQMIARPVTVPEVMNNHAGAAAKEPIPSIVTESHSYSATTTGTSSPGIVPDSERESELDPKPQGTVARLLSQRQANGVPLNQDVAPSFTGNPTTFRYASTTVPWPKTPDLNENESNSAISSTEGSATVQATPDLSVTDEKTTAFPSEQSNNFVSVDENQFSPSPQIQGQLSNFAAKPGVATEAAYIQTAPASKIYESIQAEVTENSPVLQSKTGQAQKSRLLSDQQVVAENVRPENTTRSSTTDELSININSDNETPQFPSNTFASKSTRAEQPIIDSSRADDKSSPMAQATVATSEAHQTVRPTAAKELPSRPPSEINHDDAIEVPFSVSKADKTATSASTSQPKDVIQSNESLDTLTQIFTDHINIPEIIAPKSTGQASEVVSQQITEKTDVKAVLTRSDLPEPEISESIGGLDVFVKNQRYVEREDTTVHAPNVVRIEPEFVAYENVADELISESNQVLNQPTHKPATSPAIRSEPILGDSVKPASGLPHTLVGVNAEHDVPGSGFVAETKIPQSAEIASGPAIDAKIVEETSTVSNMNADRQVHSAESLFASASEASASQERATTRTVNSEKLSSDTQSSSQTSVKHTSELVVSGPDTAEKSFISEKPTNMFVKNTDSTAEATDSSQTVRAEIATPETKIPSEPTSQAENASDSFFSVDEDSGPASRPMSVEPGGATLISGNPGKGTVNSFEPTEVPEERMQTKVESNDTTDEAANEVSTSSRIPVPTQAPVSPKISTSPASPGIVRTQTVADSAQGPEQVPSHIEAEVVEKPVVQQTLAPQEIGAAQSDSGIPTARVDPQTTDAHNSKNTETQEDIVASKSVDQDASETQPGNTFVKGAELNNQGTAANVDPAANLTEPVVVEPKERLNTGGMSSAEDSRPSDSDETVLPGPVIYPDIRNSQTAEAVAGPNFREKPHGEYLESIAGQIAEQNLPGKVEPVEVKVTDPAPVVVEPRATLVTNQNEVLEQPQHHNNDGSEPVEPAIHSTVSDVQPAEDSIVIVESEHYPESIRVNRSADIPGQVVEVKVQSHDYLTAVQVSEHDFVSVELKEKPGTGQAKAAEQYRFVDAHTDMPSSPVGHVDAEYSQGAGTFSGVVGGNRQDESTYTEQTANTTMPALNLSRQSNNGPVDSKIASFEAVFTQQQEISHTNPTATAENSQSVDAEQRSSSKAYVQADVPSFEPARTTAEIASLEAQGETVVLNQPVNGAEQAVEAKLPDEDELVNLNISKPEPSSVDQKAKWSLEQTKPTDNPQLIGSDVSIGSSPATRADVPDYQTTGENLGPDHGENRTAADNSADNQTTDLKVDIHEPVFVALTEKLSARQTDIVEIPELVVEDTVNSTQPVVDFDGLNAQSEKAFIKIAEPQSREETIVVDRSVSVNEQVVQRNKLSQDDMSDVKASDHRSVSAESAGSSGTSRPESATNNAQPVPTEAGAPSKNVSQASVTKTPSAEMISTFSESKTQEKPVGKDEAVNAPKQFIAESSENIDSTVDTKVFEQNEKSRTSSILVPSEHSQAIPGSPIKPIEPREAIKSRRPVARDVETDPVAEKRSEMNQRPDGVAAANGPVKEAQMPEFHGKPPVEHIQAEAAEVAQQVIRHMKANLKSGETSMHLQLNPKELGAIEVDMVSSSQGVQVTFFAEQASTGRLLETQLNQLRESLVDSGVQLSGLNISQHNTQGQKGGTFRHDTNFAPFTQQSFAERKADDAAAAERGIRQSTEIDYRV